MEPPVVPFFWVLRQAGRPWFAPLYGRSRATLAAARPVGSSGLLEVQAKSTGAVPGLWVSLAAALGVLCQSTPQRAVPRKNKGRQQTLQV